ncbi:MAG: hypothetical protein ABF757_03285, partial [Acetobacter papayae]
MRRLKQILKVLPLVAGLGAVTLSAAQAHPGGPGGWGGGPGWHDRGGWGGGPYRHNGNGGAIAG